MERAGVAFSAKLSFPGNCGTLIRCVVESVPVRESSETGRGVRLCEDCESNSTLSAHSSKSLYNSKSSCFSDCPTIKTLCSQLIPSGNLHDTMRLMLDRQLPPGSTQAGFASLL